MRSWIKDDRGAAAMIFAIAIIPVMLMVGMATDYSIASKEKVRMNLALDAAALAGAKQARESYGAGDRDWNAKAVAAATKMFEANHLIGTGPMASFQASAVQTGGDIKFTANASSSVPTSFMRLAGIDRVSITSSASASSSGAKYVDIHILVDTSPSMGIGATVADQTLLYAKTGCQIACHYRWGNPGDTLAAARSTGAVLRLDVVKTTLTMALGNIPKDGRTRVAIYTLGNTLTPVFPLSNDLNAAVAALGAIELTNASGQGGTNMGQALRDLNQTLVQAKDGSSQANAAGAVVLATDGVEDNLVLYAAGSGYNWATDPNFQFNSPTLADGSGLNFQTLDPSRCGPIKTKGYSFFTLEVAYVIPSPVPSGYDLRLNFIKNTLLKTEIPKAFSDCASTPQNYYRAETPNDIASAIGKIFSAIRPLQLVN